jgi:hypothetical protein
MAYAGHRDFLPRLWKIQSHRGSDPISSREKEQYKRKFLVFQDKFLQIAIQFCQFFVQSPALAPSVGEIPKAEAG